MVYEVVTFQALREQLRCKEIWVVGADSWRNPDEDLPQDFDGRRIENYRELRKPLDPAVFIDDLREEMTAALSELDNAIPSSPVTRPHCADRPDSADRFAATWSANYPNGSCLPTEVGQRLDE
jgi:hypothetical protein